MSQTFYKENREQQFPFILPVLKSYKQNVMFEHSINSSYDFELPQLETRWFPVSKSSMKKNKKKKRRIKKSSMQPKKNSSRLMYSPHFNVSRGSPYYV